MIRIAAAAAAAIYIIVAQIATYLRQPDSFSFIAHLRDRMLTLHLFPAQTIAFPDCTPSRSKATYRPNCGKN